MSAVIATEDLRFAVMVAGQSKADTITMDAESAASVLAELRALRARVAELEAQNARQADEITELGGKFVKASRERDRLHEAFVDARGYEPDLELGYEQGGA